MSVFAAIKFMSRSAVVTTNVALLKSVPFKFNKFVAVSLENGKANGLECDKLAKLLEAFDSAVPVLLTDINTVNAHCDKLLSLRPVFSIVVNSSKDKHLELLFGKKLLDARNYTVYSSFSPHDLRKADTFDDIVALYIKRLTTPDFQIVDNKLKFTQDQPRRWVYSKLGIEDFVYRLNGQNYKLLRTNAADRNRLFALVEKGYLSCDDETRRLLMQLQLEIPVKISNAPFIEPSLLARFAAIADTQTIFSKTNERISVLTYERPKFEYAQVLTVLEDGSVEYADVERIHRKLCVCLPSSIRSSKDVYSEDDAELLAQEFELPTIPTIAEIAPERLKKAYEAIGVIENIIADRTGRKLMKFQRDDIARLLAKGSGILGWDPGLGKTIAGLVFALGAVAMGQAKPRVLVVAPQDLVLQWLREVEKFFGHEMASEFIIVRSYEDAIRLRQLSKIVPKEIPLYAITWYEVLRSVPYKEQKLERKDHDVCPMCKERIWKNKCAENCPIHDGILLKARDAAFWLKEFVRNGVLIVDEATYAKSDDSLRGIATRRLVTARCRLLLTGTPIKNLLSDLPMLLQLAAKPNSDAYPFPAETEGVTRFSKQFMVVEKNLLTRRRRLAPEPTNVAMLQKMLSGIIIRRTKDQTGEEIVPLTIKVHKVPLTSCQLEWYRAWCNDELFERWFYETHAKPLSPIAKLLSRMAHLLFVTSHPTSTTAVGSPIKLSYFRPLPEPSELTHKNRLVVDLAERFYREAGYCVVFVQTVGVASFLAKELKARKVPVHMTMEIRDGKTQSLPPFKRSSVIRQFADRGGVLLASISAMAHGHDLAFVPRAVIHSLCFAYDNYAQAIMRVHRIVSEKPVEVHVVVGVRTLDEYLLDLLRRKDEAAKTVLNGSVLEKAISITPEEWRKLWEQVISGIDDIEVTD